MPTSPPRLLSALYRATIRLQPEARRRRYGDEQWRVFMDIWHAERPPTRRARWAWSGGLLIRSLGAAWAAHADLRASGSRALGTRRLGDRSLRSIGRDMTFTIRALRHAPWYTATVIGVSAVALALATTVFAVVDGVLFRPLPYPEADRLVRIAPGFKGFSRPANATWAVSEVDLANWSAASGLTFTAFNPAGWAELGPGVNQDTAGMAQIQANFFDVIGVAPLFGGLTEDDFRQPAGGRILPVILSYGAWQTRFGGAPDVIGRVEVIDPSSGFGFRVAGVMPEAFTFPTSRTAIDLLTPFVSDPAARLDPTRRTLTEVITRLPDQMRPALLAERLSAGLARTAVQFPAPGPREPGWTDNEWRAKGAYEIVDVIPLASALGSRVRPMFLAVSAFVTLLVLIAAANVSSLMTARAWERHREFALRRALGASPASVARLWLLEAVLLLSMGALLGVLASGPALTFAVSLLPEDVVLLKAARLDWRVGLFVIAAIASLSVLVALGPVRRSLGPSPTQVRSGAIERVRTPGRFLLIAAQVAAAFVLTVVGACLVGSLLAVYGNDQHVATAGVIVIEARLQGPGRGARQLSERIARGQHILEALRQVPSISEATLVSAQLLRGGSSGSAYDTWGVTAGFYRVLGLSAIEGRVPSDEELRSSAPVIVVSEGFARARWPDSRAIGQTLNRGGEPHRVVGVVPDVPWSAWDVNTPVVYMPYARASDSLLTFFARTNGRAGEAIDQALRAVVAADPLVRPRVAATLDDLFRDSVSLRRFQSWLFGGFAAAGLIVVGAGILGLLAMSTARRTREIGIRCALGATPGSVSRQLVREQVGAVVAGLCAGGVFAAWAVGLVEGYVYQLSVADPRIWGVAVALILFAAGVGAYLPALRASRIDPLLALRAE